MKKSLFFALAMAGGLLSSCSSEDTIGAGVAESVGGESSELVPIQLGVSNSVINVTRGTGTVGSIKGEGVTETNQWSGQEIYVYMFKKSTDATKALELAEFPSDDDNSPLDGPVFDNAKMFTPEVAGETAAVREDDLVKYYPPTGNFDFWGYRLDDANANPMPEPNEEGTEYRVDFTIDGTQDVVVAKAKLTEEDKATIAKWEDQSKKENYYSAYAARNDVQPTLTFKHLLTRLQFEVKDGSKNGNNISLVGIRVKSKTTGKLVVAYSGLTERENVIEWDPTADMQYLSLKKRADDAVGQNNKLVDLTIDLNDIDKTSAENVAKYIPLTETLQSIGEAMLVSPEDDYDMEILLCQNVKSSAKDPSIFVPEIFTVPGTIINKNKEGIQLPFQAATSYNVQITLYGLQEIIVNTTLTPWEDGGSVPIIPEDQEQTETPVEP